MQGACTRSPDEISKGEFPSSIHLCLGEEKPTAGGDSVGLLFVARDDLVSNAPVKIVRFFSHGGFSSAGRWRAAAARKIQAGQKEPLECWPALYRCTFFPFLFMDHISCW